MNSHKNKLILLFLLTFISVNANALGSKRTPPNPPGLIETLEQYISDYFR